MTARTLIMLVAATVGAGLARGQDALVLRRTARIEPGRPLVLGDVASLRGEGVEPLGGLVIIDDPEGEPTDARGWFRVELGRVGERLTERLGESAGMIAMSGSACDVRVVSPPPAGAPAADTAAPVPAATDATGLVRSATIRGSVARELARVLRVEPAAMRLAFEPGEEAFLDLPAAGQTLEIAVLGSSDRLPIAVTRYDAAGRADRHTVRVTVRVRRPVAVVSRPVGRGRVIEPGDLAADHRWTLPTDRVVSLSEAAGSVAKRTLEPGEVVAVTMIEPPVLIHRGDEADIRVFHRGLVVARKAYALADGREGETIDFALKDSARQRVRAAVVGRGQATIAPRGAVSPGTALASDGSAG